MGNAQAFELNSNQVEGLSLRTACPQYNGCDSLCYLPNGTRICNLAFNKRHSIQQGEMLFRQHDPFSVVYLVRKGSIKTERVIPNGQLIVTGFHFPGDLVGLESLAGVRQSASGFALEKSEVCEFNVRRLLSLTAQEPALNTWFIHRLGRSLKQKDTALCWSTRLKCSDRVLRFFVELHDRLKTCESHSAEHVRKPMSKQDIAMYLNMSPETLSRAIGKLRDAGSLRVDTSAFTLTDVQQARQRTRL